MLFFSLFFGLPKPNDFAINNVFKNTPINNSLPTTDEMAYFNIVQHEGNTHTKVNLIKIMDKPFKQY